MASTSGKKKSSSGSRSTKSRNSGNRKKQQTLSQDSALIYEISLIIFFVVMFILFLCNFGLIGPFGNAVSSFMFGTFGFLGYLAPIFIFLAVAFKMVNEGNPTAIRKLVSGIVLFLMGQVIFDLIAKDASSLERYNLVELYNNCSNNKNGGGVIGGTFTYFFNTYLGTVGTLIIVVLISTICIILLTEKSLIDSLRNGGYYLKEKNEISAERRKEFAKQKREEYEEIRERRAEERKLREEEKENEKIFRMEKKVIGITSDTNIKSNSQDNKRKDMHEIMFVDEADSSTTNDTLNESNTKNHNSGIDFSKVNINTAHRLNPIEEPKNDNQHKEENVYQTQDIRVHKGGVVDKSGYVEERQTDYSENTSNNTDNRPKAVLNNDTPIEKEIKKTQSVKPVKYMFPPLSRLQKGTNSGGDSTEMLKETAIRLQQTLDNFGVKVTITDISQGPSVTRYELSPEQGVKVSKIVGLADDIKLNLAATDIRIEAPIPGKAAIGIEVPNKENMMVALRDLLESKEFNEFDSNLAFAVGKDIAGKVVVADIAKMPHMLIAGSTGSGKSVCINTLIMSILYKAHPDDVKLIMIDPKVVELSVYNKIPHLLIPVVTDPKKASAALHWGVSEMEDRYRKFADFNVRDLKGYNKKIESMRENGEADIPNKMPQIVIIVDELADLMMVAPGEVEESICRLAQLARAAGIHLVIATQRPSVDVITGLIKANMPSRVAFAVSSGVDSRTILDMNGAEKLLGKGDMLFYPQGYTKPARIQGAFVSDKEVSDVVDFLKNQAIGNVYAEDSEKIEEKLNSMASSSSAGISGGSGDDKDALFAEAGRFIIDKDKASIGMLQRVFKIGFNRAARIMDQLSEYGVVGEEEGTKPRKILMSMSEFEQLLEEIG